MPAARIIADHSTALGDRDWRQVDPVSDISDRMDAPVPSCVATRPPRSRHACRAKRLPPRGRRFRCSAAFQWPSTRNRPRSRRLRREQAMVSLGITERNSAEIVPRPKRSVTCGRRLPMPVGKSLTERRNLPQPRARGRPLLSSLLLHRSAAGFSVAVAENRLTARTKSRSHCAQRLEHCLGTRR